MKFPKCGNPSIKCFNCCSPSRSVLLTIKNTNSGSYRKLPSCHHHLIFEWTVSTQLCWEEFGNIQMNCFDNLGWVIRIGALFRPNPIVSMETLPWDLTALYQYNPWRHSKTKLYVTMETDGCYVTGVLLSLTVLYEYRHTYN